MRRRLPPRLSPACMLALLLPIVATSAAPTAAPVTPSTPPQALTLAPALPGLPSMPPTPPTPAPHPLFDRLAAAAPTLDRDVLQLATRALGCALRQPGVDAPRTLSVIDYSLPSTKPRMWVFDLLDGDLLFEEWVAHGRNTGGNLATAFSNVHGSYQSSLGTFLTQESYVGSNGYSLRLQGLEPGFNDLARERAIVIHGAPYVNPDTALAQGRLGRSLGCPAVRTAVARELIDTIRDGSLVVAYYPDPDWLQRSELLVSDCGAAMLAGSAAAGPD